MQLFSRRVLLVGPPSETVPYATEMREFVSEAIGREVALWAANFGAPVGTMLYTMRVDGVADLADATSGLMENEEYQRRLADHAHLNGAPAEDSLGTPIFGELGDHPPVGSYAQVVSAVIANGMYAEGFAWGAEIAAYVAELTGVPEMFLAGQFGPFGNVTWIAVAPDAATVDRANATTNADAEYMKRLTEARDLFVPGSGQQALVSRIA